MGFRLRITLKTKKTFVMLTAPPESRWCEVCRADSSFVDEEREARSLRALPTGIAHRQTIDGRAYLCLRSIAEEP